MATPTFFAGTYSLLITNKLDFLELLFGSLFHSKFFADPKDLELRSHENSFMLGPLLIYARLYISSLEIMETLLLRLHIMFFILQHFTRSRFVSTAAKVA